MVKLRFLINPGFIFCDSSLNLKYSCLELSRVYGLAQNVSTLKYCSTLEIISNISGSILIISFCFFTKVSTNFTSFYFYRSSRFSQSPEPLIQNFQKPLLKFWLNILNIFVHYDYNSIKKLIAHLNHLDDRNINATKLDVSLVILQEIMRLHNKVY